MSAARKFEEYERSLKRGPARVSISGSGVYDGETLRVSGSARVEGDLVVSEVRASGSLTCVGSVRAAVFRVSGSAKVTGDLRGELVRASGSLSVGGSLSAEESLKISGSASIAGLIEGGEVRVSGALEASSIKCGTLVASGSLRVGGDVECRSFELTAEGRSVIRGSLRAEEVVVRGGEARTVVRIGPLEISVSRRRRGFLKVGRVEGANVDLEYVECEEVRARRVRIGKGCRVMGNVYYAEEAEVDPAAVVRGQLVRVEPSNGGEQRGGGDRG
ncbi:MAG: hypothetical protein DRJ67_03895 [Thermoprotei archaeon]|nr:MAG: hypothetical protein DRJ67_03895 [Thermoprotei archaeon]